MEGPQSPAPDPQAPSAAGQEPPGGWHQPAAPVATVDDAYAVKTGLGRAWGFAILSFGFWTYVWFYRQRKLIDGELGHGRDDATLHTLGLLVPILNFFIVYWFWRDVNEVRRRVGLEPFPDVAYIVGSIFLAPVFYSLALGHVNEYWDVRTQGLASEGRVTSMEKVAIGVGIAIWALFVLTIVVSILIVIIAAGASS